MVNILSVELHIPGYQCGPQTQFDKRLPTADEGMKKLDSACKDHDIIYSQSKYTKLDTK